MALLQDETQGSGGCLCESRWSSWREDSNSQLGPYSHTKIQPRLFKSGQQLARGDYLMPN